MRIGTRLWLAIAPGVIGVVTVAALGYWGEFGRQVPAAFVVIAAAATLLSIALAGWNIRYIVQRVDRLSHEAHEVRRRVVEAGFEALRNVGIGHGSPDELESLEGLVSHLAETAVAAERSARERERAAAARLHEAGALIRATAADLGGRLDEVRLPIHILLENRFGDLNENQEEMLGVARAATDTAAEGVRRAITVLAAEDGVLALRRDRIHGGELADGLVIRMRTAAEARHVRLEAVVEAPLPSLSGDRMQLQEALKALFVSAVMQATDGSSAALRVWGGDGSLRLTLRYVGASIAGMPVRYGEALVAAHDGAVSVLAGEVSVRLPVAVMAA